MVYFLIEKIILLLFFQILYLFLGGLEFKFEFTQETGDWSVLQKSLGNKNGGYQRCVLCGLDFGPHNCHQILSYSHLISQIPKSISLSANLFSHKTLINENLKERLGFKEIAAVLSGLSSEQRKELLSTVMKDSKLMIGSINLRNNIISYSILLFF